MNINWLPIEMKLLICDFVSSDLQSLLRLKQVNLALYHLITGNCDRFSKVGFEDSVLQQREDREGKMVFDLFFDHRKSLTNLTSADLCRLPEILAHVTIGTGSEDDHLLMNVTVTDELLELLHRVAFHEHPLELHFKFKGCTAQPSSLYSLVRYISPAAVNLSGDFDRSIITDQLFESAPRAFAWCAWATNVTKSRVTAHALLAHARRHESHSVFRIPDCELSIQELLDCIQTIVLGGQRQAEIFLENSSVDATVLDAALLEIVPLWKSLAESDISYEMSHCCMTGREFVISVCSINRPQVTLTLVPDRFRYRSPYLSPPYRQLTV